MSKANPNALGIVDTDMLGFALLITNLLKKDKKKLAWWAALQGLLILCRGDS